MNIIMYEGYLYHVPCANLARSGLDGLIQYLMKPDRIMCVTCLKEVQWCNRYRVIVNRLLKRSGRVKV